MSWGTTSVWRICTTPAVERVFRYTKGDFEGGLVVWRIDEHVLEEAWWENTVNNTEGKYGIMPLLFYDDPQLLALEYPELFKNGLQSGISPLSVSDNEELRTRTGSPFLKFGMKPLTLTSGKYSITLDPAKTGSDGTITAVVDGYIEPALPQTGDDSRLVLWACLLLASAGAALLLALRRKRA